MPHDDDEPRSTEQEGVRIIGAEEAAEALGRGDVAHRLPSDEPRFGDRPVSPDVGDARPTIRFPLPADDGGDFAAPRPAPPADLPHWTDPPTGEVPRIFAVEDLEGDTTSAGSWSSFGSGQPRWRGEGPDLDDDYDDFSQLADDETRVGAMAGDDRPDPEDFFAFDDDAEPAPTGWGSDDPVPIGGWDDDYDDGRTRSISSDPRRAAARRGTATYQRPANAGRDVPVAIGVGVAFAAVALVCFKLGATATVGLITVVLAVAAVELFSVLRQAGYQPATLLGISATVALPLAAYYKGETGLPLVLFLTVVFGLIWYLAGAGGADRPVIGLSSTLLGVLWIGLLGSFAALMVADPLNDQGIGILLVAVLGTVGYDVGGFVVGRNAGTRPLSAASPNKTIEGLVGGILGAVVVAGVAGTQISPFADADFTEVLLVAVGIAVAAPLGDLCQSLVKRDLDVKDMGTILPGHGGFLDRFDALLFVLPTVYYLARVIFS